MPDTPKKSFHNEDFEPEILNSQLRDILNHIDTSKIYKDFSLDKLAFQFKGIDYQIWTGLKKKHVGGKEIEFRRLNTFYPITDIDERKKLLDNYKTVNINKYIKVYLPK